MTITLISILTGLLAGLIHVFSGPDHLAAIAPLAAKSPKRAAANGFRWGLGHAAGVLTVGFLSLCFRDLLPMNTISSISEQMVGVVLIGVAFWGFRCAWRIHAHEHRHNGETHEHLHVHAPGRAHGADETHVHTHAAFGIGTLHGLAGSSHFLGILPALAFPTTIAAASYLIAFGMGTVVAMSIFSSSIGALAKRFSGNRVVAYRRLMWCTSTAALGVGGFWLFAG